MNSIRSPDGARCKHPRDPHSRFRDIVLTAGQTSCLITYARLDRHTRPHAQPPRGSQPRHSKAVDRVPALRLQTSHPQGHSKKEVGARPALAVCGRCRHARPNSIPKKTSGSSCAQTGSPTASSSPTRTSLTTAALPRTRSSISPGKSCPSPAANGQQSVSHREDWYKPHQSRIASKHVAHMVHAQPS